jgi:hypothetical protein
MVSYHHLEKNPVEAYANSSPRKSTRSANCFKLLNLEIVSIAALDYQNKF